MVEFSEIIVSTEGRAGIIQFNRPHVRNAISDTMLEETRRAMQAWELDDSILAVILTGDEVAFCAGGDLKGTAASKLTPFQKYRWRYNQSVWHEFMRFLGNYSKPAIAAVEGYAFGGGVEISLHCDFVVASESARMGITEAKHGLFPILGGAWSLARAVGERRAKELAFTGRRFGATEALEYGIANHITPKGGAVSKAVKIVSEMESCGPLAIMAAKQAINRSHRQTFEEALIAGGDLSALLMFSEDREEGLTAFAEKRDAEFKGR